MLSSPCQIVMSSSIPTIHENTLPITGQFFNQLSKTAPIVGFAWIASSMLFTTYSTTSFLKYRPLRNILPHNHRKSKNESYYSTTSIISSALHSFAKVIDNRPACELHQRALFVVPYCIYNHNVLMPAPIYYMILSFLYLTHHNACFFFVYDRLLIYMYQY